MHSLKRIAVALIIISPVLCLAQKPYLAFGVMDGFAGNNTLLQQIELTQANYVFSQGVYGSYGKSYGVQAAFGKMINANFGFELSGAYNNGKKIRVNSSGTTENFSYSGQVIERMNTVIFTPKLVLRNSGDLLNIYTKIGLPLILFGRRNGQENYVISDENTKESLVIETRYAENSKLKIGFSGTLGFSYRLSKAYSFYGELGALMASLSITEGRYTRFTENGQDILGSLTTHEKEWKYVESGLLSEPGSDNEPEERLYIPANYATISLGVGVIYHL